MATINSNYYQLQAISVDIKKLLKQFPSLEFLLKRQLSDFRQLNQIRLSYMDTRRKDMVAKYVMHDDAGKPLMEKAEGDIDIWKYEDAEKQKEHEKAFAEFMSAEIQIKF